MHRTKYVSRATLARYAAVLGRFSAAGKVLTDYDIARAAGRKPRIEMHLTGFRLVYAGARA